MDEHTAIAMSLSGFFTMVGWLFWVVATNIRRAKVARAQADLQSKLLDRFGSSKELLEYLQSEAGVRFVEAGTADRVEPESRILRSLQGGIVMLSIGVAFQWLRYQLPGAAEGFLICGALAIALGVGLLASGALAWRLSKTWGVIPQRTPER